MNIICAKIKKNIYTFFVHHLYFIIDTDKYEKKLNKIKTKILRQSDTQKHMNCCEKEICTSHSIINALKNAVNGNKILIIGRIAEGDSIANHTKAFLNIIDYSTCNVWLFDEYSNNVYKMNGANKKDFVMHCHPKEIDGTAYDLLLFCNVINCGTDSFFDKVPYKKSFISLCYSVYDGTIPPKGWVDAINNYFDALLVPVENLKTSFVKNGVLKPVFVLPVSLDLKKYIFSKKTAVNTYFTFGWIGAVESRKNIIKIINAFKIAFENNPEIRLRLHTRFIDTRTPDGRAFKKIMHNLPNNIIWTNSIMSDEELSDLMRSFDAYIYVSKGEGYSVTPREALACGHPVILSSIPTHKCITSLGEGNGVFWVPANIEVDAIQPSLNNQICGKMYDIEEADLVDQMKKLYSERMFICDAKNEKIRKETVSDYDKDELSFIYKQLICPKKIDIDDINEITQYSFKTNDINLKSKYDIFIKNQTQKYIICPIHDGGFFSILNKYVSHLCYCSDDAILIPDWRVSTLKIDVLTRTKTLNFESFCYGNEKDGNLFFKLFENPFPNHLHKDIQETDLMYVIADEKLDSFDFNVLNEPNLTYINSYNLYDDDDYFPIFRKRYNNTLKKYIRLKPEIQKRIDDFFEKNLKNHFVVAAFIRCKGHALELKENSPDIELWENKLLEILKQNNISVSSDKWKFFIASDNENAINFFSKKYPENTVFQNMQRLTREQEQEYENKKNECGHDISGYELQHRKAADKRQHSLSNAVDVIFDVWTGANADYLIYTNSNMSTAASYINPKLKMVYCK